jgi:hypothetical protein
MNDLERDLATLFRERADDIETRTVPPGNVLRRGRRRQIGTILGGAAVIVSTILALIIAIAATPPAPDSIPAVSSYPSRATTIHGIPVTAPAGWTLVDDWPLASMLPTSSQTCTFSASGVPVGPSPELSPSSEPAAGPSSSCSSEAVPLPAGVPVLQLANFSFRLDGSLCTAGELQSVDVPADGVAMYVAAFDGPMKTADVLDACPGSRNLTTFADRGVQQLYVGVSIVGPDANAADVATIDRAMNDLGGIRIPDGQAVATSPGYVVASGDDGTTAWRIEAGFLFRDSTSGIGTTLITSDENAHETVSDPVAPVGSGEDPSEEMQPLTPQPSALIWGTSPPDVTAIANVTPDGTPTEATLVPWPDEMRATVAEDEQPQLDGWIWFATVPEPGRIETSRSVPQSVSPSRSTHAEQLRTRQTDAGDLVIYGNDLGHGWELRHEDGRIVLYLDGSSTPAGSVDMVNGRWGVIDVDGGSFVVGSFDDSVRRLWVTPQGSDASIEGGYADAQDRTGAPGRVWLIALPGTGWGTLENGVATRGWWISWPSVTNLHRGAVLRAGGDGTDVSWSLVWQDDHCVQLQVDTSSIAGTGDCLPPWVDLQRSGGTPLVGGVYGQRLAVIALVLPPDATIASFRTDGAGPDPECPAPIRVESNYSNTQFCLLPLAVGSSATITVDAGGDPLGSPFGITAQPGSIDFTQGAMATAAPSPSPTP